MIRYGCFLTLVACALATSRAIARGPQSQSGPRAMRQGTDQSPQRQSATGMSDWRFPVEPPHAALTPAGWPVAVTRADIPYSPFVYAQSGSGYEPYDRQQSGEVADKVGNGAGPATGGESSASLAAASGSGPARALTLILAASGVPHQNGEIAWPPVLRLVNAESEMQRVQALLQLTAEQVIAGGANPKLLDEIRLTVDGLRRLLREDKAARWPSLPADLYNDAESFLQALSRVTRIAGASVPVRR